MCLKPLYALFTFLSHPVLIMMRNNWAKSFRKRLSSEELPHNLAGAYTEFLIEKLKEEYKKSGVILHAQRLIGKSSKEVDDANRGIDLNAALYIWVRGIIVKHTPH